MTKPIVFVTGGEGGGGVLSFVRDLAPAVAQYVSGPVIHLGLVNRPARPRMSPDHYSVETLGLAPAQASPAETCRAFLRWVDLTRPSAILLNDISQIEDAWASVPAATRLVVVLHDEAMRFRRPLLANAAAVDHVVVVAEYLKRLIASDSRELAGKTVAIHNGVRFPADRLAPARRPMGDRTIEVLYVGGMDYLKKGIQDLPRLARVLKRRGVPFRLHIAGGHDEHLARLFSKHGVDGHVIWKGKLGADQVLQAAAMADFFFLPSRCEPFGLVTVEAMGMGCIPFAYDIESGSREIIEQGESGWLLPLADVGAVADKMTQMTRDEALVARMRARAMHRARTAFSIQVAAKRYAELVAEVVLRADSRSRANASPRAQPANSIVASLAASAARGYRSGARSLVARFPSLVQPFWRRFG